MAPPPKPAGPNASPSVDLTIDAGTLRATIVHGEVDLAWWRDGARAPLTTRRSLDETDTFAGTLHDLIENERIRQRQRESA